MKKLLPILAVAFLAGCTAPGHSSHNESLSSSESEETTSEVSSSREDSTSGDVSCLALECEENSSSETTSSEEVSSSETTTSSEDVSSSEPLPTYTINVLDNLVDLPDNIIVSHENPVEEGTPITITAGEIDGYTFLHWLVPDTQEIVSTEATLEITIENNINLVAVYEAVIVETFATDLFISEYIEGASNNKAFEIANFTGAPVDLSQYTVQLFGNGSATTTRPIQALTGTLNHGEVFVIAGTLTADPGMVAALEAIPAERKIISTFEEGSIAASYNGDDAIAILKGQVIIDVFGTIGFDPGTGWDKATYGVLADGVTAQTVDRTLTRLPEFGPFVGPLEYNAVTYNTAFNPIEWRVDAVHTQTLGTHVFSIAI